MSKECVVCNNKVGVGSYKISNGQYACGSCMKKAGYGMTTTYKVIRSLTKEDLMNGPDKKRASKSSNRHETLGQDKMKSAEEMSEFCIKHGYGKGQSKKWTLKHFALIEDALSRDEYAIFSFVGLHNYISMTKHDNNYAYALTNKRLIVAQQRLIGNQIQSIMLDKLNDVTKNRGALLGVIVIDTINEKLNVAVDKETADNIANALNEIIYNEKHPHAVKQPENTDTKLSPVDEIKKYKELLDLEIITQEEFDIKKKELLEL